MVLSHGLNAGLVSKTISIITTTIIIVLLGIIGYLSYKLIKYYKSFNIRTLLFSITQSGIVFALDKARIIKDKTGRAVLQLRKFKEMLPIPQEPEFIRDLNMHKVLFLVKKGEGDWAFWKPLIKNGVLDSELENINKNWYAEKIKSTYEKYPKWKSFWERYAGIISVGIIIITVIIFFIILSKVLQDTGKSFEAAAKTIADALRTLNATMKK